MANAQSSVEAGAQRVQQEMERRWNQRGRRKAVNVGKGEQYGSVLTGSGLIIAGLIRRGVGGLFLSGLGLALVQRGLTGHCSLYHSMGLSTAKSDRAGVPDNVGIKVERKITINRPQEEIFAFWRDFRNLPRFMKHLRRVDILDEKRSHWVAAGIAGGTVEWDAELINEHPNELIAWESLPGSKVGNAGSVRFSPAPDGRGTEVKVDLEYNPPGGILGALGARLFGEAPEQQVADDLLRLKKALEGEPVEEQTTGRRRMRSGRL